jgi:nucleoside-diphosphate-sugar epimerase
MKVLLTGATGFIGSFLLEKLIEENYDVRIIRRKSSNLQFIKDLGVETFEASLDEVDKLKAAAKNCEIVIHVAGLTSAKNHEGYISGNKFNTKNILDAVDKSSIKKFIYISSLTAVGPATDYDNPVHEETECNPITSYGFSKYETEKMIVEQYSNIPFVILRPPAVFGPRDKAILTVFQSINYGLSPMMGLKEKYLSLIYVKDLVDAIIDSIKIQNNLHKIYFISSDKFYSWTEVVNLIAKLMNKKVIKLKIPEFFVKIIAGISELLGTFSSKPPVFNIDKGKDLLQSYWICSNQKSKKELDFKENYSLEEAMKETIEWYKENKWL